MPADPRRLLLRLGGTPATILALAGCAGTPAPGPDHPRVTTTTATPPPTPDEASALEARVASLRQRLAEESRGGDARAACTTAGALLEEWRAADDVLRFASVDPNDASPSRRPDLLSAIDAFGACGDSIGVLRVFAEEPSLGAERLEALDRALVDVPGFPDVFALPEEVASRLSPTALESYVATVAGHDSFELPDAIARALGIAGVELLEGSFSGRTRRDPAIFRADAELWRRLDRWDPRGRLVEDVAADLAVHGEASIDRETLSYLDTLLREPDLRDPGDGPACDPEGGFDPSSLHPRAAGAVRDALTALGEHPELRHPFLFVALSLHRARLLPRYASELRALSSDPDDLAFFDLLLALAELDEGRIEKLDAWIATRPDARSSAYVQTRIVASPLGRGPRGGEAFEALVGIHAEALLPDFLRPRSEARRDEDGVELEGAGTVATDAPSERPRLATIVEAARRGGGEAARAELEANAAELPACDRTVATLWLAAGEASGPLPSLDHVTEALCLDHDASNGWSAFREPMKPFARTQASLVALARPDDRSASDLVLAAQGVEAVRAALSPSDAAMVDLLVALALGPTAEEARRALERLGEDAVVVRILQGSPPAPLPLATLDRAIARYRDLPPTRRARLRGRLPRRRPDWLGIPPNAVEDDDRDSAWTSPVGTERLGGFVSRILPELPSGLVPDDFGARASRWIAPGDWPAVRTRALELAANDPRALPFACAVLRAEPRNDRSTRDVCMRAFELAPSPALAEIVAGMLAREARPGDDRLLATIAELLGQRASISFRMTYGSYLLRHRRRPATPSGELVKVIRVAGADGEPDDGYYVSVPVTEAMTRRLPPSLVRDLPAVLFEVARSGP